MVEINDILDAINRDIFKAYKDFTFYVNFEPKNFKRPSIFLEFVRLGRQGRIAHNVINQTLYFTLTYFAPTDEYYRPDKMGLHDVMGGVLKIYRSGCIEVGDRFLKITATTGGENEREIYIDLQIDVTDNVFDSLPTFDKMQKIITTIKED